MFKFLKDKLKSAISKISEGVEKEGKIEEKEIEVSAQEKKEEEKGFFAKLKEKFVGKEEEKEVFQEEKIDIKIEIAEDKKQETKKEKPIHVKHKREEIKHPIKIKEEKIVKKEEIKEYRKIEPKVEIKEEIPKHKIDEKQIRIEKEPEKKGFFETIKEKIITTKINQEQFEKLFWELELALMENNVAMEVIEKIKNDLKELDSLKCSFKRWYLKGKILNFTFYETFRKTCYFY